MLDVERLGARSALFDISTVQKYNGTNGAANQKKGDFITVKLLEKIQNPYWESVSANKNYDTQPDFFVKKTFKKRLKCFNRLRNHEYIVQIFIHFKIYICFLPL